MRRRCIVVRTCCATPSTVAPGRNRRGDVVHVPGRIGRDRASRREVQRNPERRLRPGRGEGGDEATWHHTNHRPLLGVISIEPDATSDDVRDLPQRSAARAHGSGSPHRSARGRRDSASNGRPSAGVTPKTEKKAGSTTWVASCTAAPSPLSVSPQNEIPVDRAGSRATPSRIASASAMFAFFPGETSDEAIGVRVRERTQEHRIDHGEDRHRCADPQREGGEGHGEEAGLGAQAPRGHGEVSTNSGHRREEDWGGSGDCARLVGPAQRAEGCAFRPAQRPTASFDARRARAASRSPCGEIGRDVNRRAPPAIAPPAGGAQRAITPRCAAGCATSRRHRSPATGGDTARARGCAWRGRSS